MSFRLKTILGIALIEMTVMLILIGVNQFNLGGSARDQVFDRAQTNAELFATMAADAVISTDLATLDSLIENAIANDAFVYLRVRSPSGVILSEGGDLGDVSSEFSEDPTNSDRIADQRIDTRAEISVAGTKFGFVELGVSTVAVDEEIRTALRWNLLVAAIGILLVASFGYVLGSILTKQLWVLRDGAQVISKGDLSHRIDDAGKDEIAVTARSFNQMAEALANDKQLLVAKQNDLLEKKALVEEMVGRMTEISKGNNHIIAIPGIEREDEIGDMARASAIFQEAMHTVVKARKELERLVYAFDQLEEQVVIFGEDDRAIFRNRAFEAFNSDALSTLEDNFSYSEFLYAAIAEGDFPEASEDPDGWVSCLEEAAEAKSAPVEVRRVGGKTHVLTSTLVVGVGHVVSAADVTELRESQSQLIQASKLATLGEMATGVAHELNQPLGVIRMAAANTVKAIDRGKSDPAYISGKLQRIQEQTERAAQIITHMRVFGRTAEDTAQPFDASEAIQDVYALMYKPLRVLNIEFELVSTLEPTLILGQQVLFEQVLVNLISNARDAIESNESNETTEGRIVLNAHQSSANTLMIEIEDNGGGFKDVVLDRLFEPFFTTKEPGKGTGLGLSISYGTVKEMQGTITASNGDTGAVFCIELPVLDVSSSEAVPLEQATRNSA